MKRYILVLFSGLLSINLIACSSSNIGENKKITAIKISTNNVTSSKWKNKTYISIGDSITWQDKQKYPDANKVAIGYQSFLDQKIGFKNIINYSISGASMAKSSKYPARDSIMVRYITKKYSNVDLITILAGTNDFKLNVPIGEIGKKDDKNFDESTFYGSYRKLLDYILKQNQLTKIYLFTPLQRDNDGYDINKINPAGFKLIDYADAVKKIGELYNLPVLDLYTVSGIDISNIKQYTRDGLHPNDKGYELISKPIYDFLEKN